MTWALGALAFAPILLALFLFFLAGARRALGGKWRRFALAGLVLVCLGWFMAAFTGYVWGYNEVQKYYERIFKELFHPRKPAEPKADKNIVET